MIVTAGVGAALSEQVLTGPLALALPIAALAGLVSFASPCVLPLVPGYLAYAAGLAGGDAPRDSGSPLARRMLFATAGFVAGYTVVFVAMGITVGVLGQFLLSHTKVLTTVLGVVVMVFGVLIAAGPAATERIPLLGGLPISYRPAAGLAGAPILGAVFGLGFSPCIGPVLGAVLSIGMNTGSPYAGAALAVSYCLGLAIPFFVAAALLSRGVVQLGWMHRHRTLISRLGGGAIAFMGLLLATGVWNTLIDALRVPISMFETVI